jgi:Fe-Mn family superoxide dismutase
METSRMYSLPELPYKYTDLMPYISEEQLRLHHLKHHQAYVNGANAIIEKLEKARKENAEIDMKSILKEFSFHLGGYKLHNLFWKNMAPPNQGGGGNPTGDLARIITREFTSLDRFKKEFTQAAVSTEGSGWAALAFCEKTKRLLILQIEKHNTNLIPQFPILLVLDVWEHAYYLDYRNDRAKFVENFWNLVNWDSVAFRFEELKK